MKYIPMPYRQQVKAKLLSGLILGILCTTGYLLIFFLIALAVGAPLPLPAVVLSVVVTVLLNGGMNIFQLWRDLCRPKLVWENEQQAVKQNLNATISMFLLWVIGLGLGALAVWLYTLTEMSPYLLAAGGCVILAVLDLLLYRVLMRAADRKIAAYE